MISTNQRFDPLSLTAPPPPPPGLDPATAEAFKAFLAGGRSAVLPEVPRVPESPPAADKVEVTLKVAAPIKKVSFGGIAKKKEESKKTQYPQLPDADGSAAQLADSILELEDKLNAIEGKLDADKADIKARAKPFYFENSQGKVEVASSVAIRGMSGREVLVTFANSYTKLKDESPLLPLLGDKTGTFFRQSFEFKITGDKLPAANIEPLVVELQALFARYNAADALSVSECVKPMADFHAKRHLELTPAQNLALDEACPIIAKVITKGRK